MQFQENFSLKKYNSFGIDVMARHFARFHSVAQLPGILSRLPESRLMVLGGGSNILFTSDYDGLVLRNEIRGVEKINEDDDFVYIRCGAGENWHRFVMHCISNNWAGVENLSLIPGCTGASPMQNIGAYGVELKDVFYELTAFHIEEKQNYTFHLRDCEFGYRDSIFKGRYKNQFIILDVVFRLSKKPAFHTGYGAIGQELEAMGVTELSIRAVSQAVINIRTAKLPDPDVIGNAGSFFKNPSVSKERFVDMRHEFASMPGYENADGTVKLAAGWLIEQCGWKGFRRGDVGVHARQALVLVNYGNGTGEEIYNLSEEILQSVKEKFGVELEREVNVL